jgi:hypothetical protein
MREIRAIPGAKWRTLDVLKEHIGAPFPGFPRAFPETGRWVYALLPTFDYAPFPDNATQTQVA